MSQTEVIAIVNDYIDEMEEYLWSREKAEDFLYDILDRYYNGEYYVWDY